MSIIMRLGLREQYGTVVAGEKAGLWPTCRETGKLRRETRLGSARIPKCSVAGDI
jgi:hypothetical protein